jgi:hypothetical protein
MRVAPARAGFRASTAVAVIILAAPAAMSVARGGEEPAVSRAEPAVRAAPEAAAACNDLPNSAAVVTAMRLAQDSPLAPAGGDFVEGTYFLTSTIYYTGPGGSTVPPGYTAKVTAVISRGTTAGTFDYQDVQSINGAAATRDTLRVVPNGTSFVGAHLCPTTGTLGGFQYTVTTTGFILYSTVLGTVDTYTRQP